MDFIPRNMRKFPAAGESILEQHLNPNLNPPKPITIHSRIMIKNPNENSSSSIVLVLVLDSGNKIRGRERAGERGGWRNCEKQNQTGRGESEGLASEHETDKSRFCSFLTD